MDDRPFLTEQASILNDLTCGTCGYNLRGLTLDGNCPECGKSVASSLMMKGGTTKRELAALAYRILAVWILVHAATIFAQRASYFVILMTGGSLLTPSRTGWILASGCFPFVVPAILGGVLWWQADWLACRSFPRDGLASTSTVMAAQDWFNVASVAIGLVFLILGIVTVASTAPLWNTTYRSSPDTFWSQMAGACTQFIIGLILIIGSRRIGQALDWLRTAGTQRDEDRA